MKIKTFLTAFLAMFLTFIFATQSFAIITTPMSNQVDATGTQTRKDKVFIKVKNGSGGTLATGSVVVWDSTADDGMTVTTSTTAGTFPACVTEEQMTSNSLGLCQVYGYHAGVRFTPSTPASGEATAGAALYVSGYASRATGIVAAAATDRPLGISYDSHTASGNIEVFIRLL